MRLFRRGSIAVGLSLAYFFSSLFLDLVPCQVAPKVPNPIYAWSTCNLNPDLVSFDSMQKIYWGFSSRLTDAYLLSIFISFILVFVCLSILFKQRKSKKKEE